MTVICERCERPVSPWPLKRGKRCSPDHWAFCIRNDAEIMERIREGTVYAVRKGESP